MESDSNNFIVFGKPVLTEQEIEAVSSTLRSGWIGTGPKTKEFESAFAKYQGAEQAIAVSSCTAALFVALKAYGIGPGDEVITTAMTFAATLNAIIQAGAKPVIVDVEAGHFTIDAKKAAAAVTSRTKAIIPVHFAGAPADIDALLALREKHGLKIIHDCAHAIETQWKGSRIGAIADASCYSFYSTKNITTIEGGAICSSDASFMERARLYSYQGMTKNAWKRFSASGYQHYDIVSPGFKLNFTDVQATVGLSQLATIDAKYARRSEVWNRYQEAFAGLPVTTPNEDSSEQLHARHLYTLLVDEKRAGLDRDSFLLEMHSRGIGCGVHYRSIPQLSYFAEQFGWTPKLFPNAYQVSETTLSIPLTPYLTDTEAGRIIDAVTEICRAATSRKRKTA